MCIIVFDNRRDSNERVSKKILRRCLHRNQDGMGIMYPWKGTLNFFHTMTDFKSIWDKYCTARNEGLPVAIHFRKNTKGGNVVENCHPFPTHDGSMGFMHNGTIHGLGDLPEGVSDTRYFRDAILNNLPGDFLSSQPMYNMVKSFLSGDRALFMDGQGRWSLFNETQGVWEFLPKDAEKTSTNGVWFSHRRDREFFMTGKERKKFESTNYGVYSGWVGNDTRSFTTKANVVVSTTANRVDTPNKRTKSGINLKFSEKDESLIFVYGLLRDDVPGDPFIPRWDATYVGLGELPGHSLWAIDDSTRCGRPGAMRMKDSKSESVHGFVLNLRGSVGKLLDEIDQRMGIAKDSTSLKYYRTRANVRVHRAGKDPEFRMCHVYLATPVNEINPISHHIPDGDWVEYIETATSAEDPAEFDVIPISRWINDVNDPNDDLADDTCYSAYNPEKDEYTCLICWNADQQVPFTASPDLTGEDDDIPMYWCNVCHARYPIEMTDKEIEDALDALTQ
jgi:gamma-glutamylcyclotransferase (GGCT)/AIG2-like uncharacterized protein YtfP